MQDSLSLDLPDPSGGAGAAGAHPATPPAPGLGAPLAERLRPRTIDEVVGQDHLLGPGQPVRVAGIAASLGFHLLNKLIFGIGVFPWMCVCLTTLYLPPDNLVVLEEA